jgi:hypothetical protein
VSKYLFSEDVCLILHVSYHISSVDLNDGDKKIYEMLVFSSALIRLIAREYFSSFIRLNLQMLHNSPVTFEGCYCEIFRFGMK